MPRTREGVVLHDLPDGTHALADAARGTMLVVNVLGAAIWLLLAESESLEALVDAVAETPGAARERVHQDVVSFLGELRQHGLVA